MCLYCWSFSLRERFLLVGMLLIGLAIYWPGLSGGYVFDDFGNIVDNVAMSPQAVHADFWRALWSNESGPTHRPITILTFIAQEWFTGLHPWPLKFGNVLIHLANGALIFFLTRAVLAFVYAERAAPAPLVASDRSEKCTLWLVAPNTLALLIAAAWLFAPIQLTGVLYVVQRMESLAAMFVLVGLLIYWQGRIHLIAGKRGAWGLIWGGLMGMTVIATFAKESGVMLPVYAFLLEWVIFRGRGANGFDIRIIILYVIVLVLPGIAGVLYTLPGALNGSAYANRTFDLPQRLWTEGRVMVDYLHWIIAPAPNVLSLYHDDTVLSTGWFVPWTTAASWSLIAALIGLALWLKNRAPLFALGVLWFFGGQLLVSTYIPLELVYEHRNYLPSWGVYIALFGVILSWTPKDTERRAVIRTLTVSGILALIALYAGFTALRAQIWGNPYRLAYFESTTHPDSPRASYDLGRLMMILAPSAESPLFQLGMAQMENTAKMPGSNIQADQALIFMASKNQQAVETGWWKLLRAKIARQPISAEDVGALYSLINCGINGVCKYTPTGITELGNTLRFTLARYPKNVDIITLYANYSANITHDFPLAYTLMQQAVTLDPRKYEYWKNLVTLQIAAGMFADARAGIERMRELNGKGIHDMTITEIHQKLLKKEADVHTIEGGNN